MKLDLLGQLNTLVHRVEAEAQQLSDELGVTQAANAVGDAFINVAGAAVGYAELLGLRYPVHAYQVQVSPALTRGSRVDVEGLAGLQAQGFRSTVDLRAESNSDAAICGALGMRTLHLDIIDNTPPTVQQMKQLLDFATDPANTPTYVHCEAGVGRTGVAVACYRMAVQGWSVEQALDEAKRLGDKLPDQLAFIQRFGQELAAGRIAGYPLTGAARARALQPLPPPPAKTLAQLSAQLDQVTHSRVTPGNQVQMYVDGEHAFPAVLAQLDSAKRSIHYETYNYLPGQPTAEAVTQHLIAAKKRGVDVRVVLDAFGADDYLFVHNPLIAQLKAAGIPVQLYHPIQSLADINIHRDHRKVIVVDGERAFLGGMNTGDQYFGGPTVPGRRHDVFALLQGPAVAEVDKDWASSWEAAGGKALPPSETVVPARPKADGYDVRIVQHTPGQDENIDAAYLAMINSAHSRINLENSYPMREDILAALSAAARRGVEVRYIVGSSKGLMALATDARFQELLDAGVHIFQYPTPVHTKSLSVDGTICAFGSSNVDNISLSRNREIVAIVEDPRFAQAYDAQLFDRDVHADPQGAPTAELPPKHHETLWQKVEQTVVNGLWPQTLQ